MLSPTTARFLLGHFPRGEDPPAVDQCASPPPVRSPTYLSLRAISAAGARGGGARGGAGAHRSPRDSRGGGGGETGTDGERRDTLRGRYERRMRQQGKQ